MATYFCEYCDNYIDGDYHPCEVVPGSVELICPACFEELEEFQAKKKGSIRREGQLNNA